MDDAEKINRLARNSFNCVLAAMFYSELNKSCVKRILKSRGITKDEYLNVMEKTLNSSSRLSKIMGKSVKLVEKYFKQAASK